MIRIQILYNSQIFFRVLPDLSVSNLRKEILIQLEDENIPNTFVFVRGVGRHFCEVSSRD